MRAAPTSVVLRKSRRCIVRSSRRVRMCRTQSAREGLASRSRGTILRQRGLRFIPHLALETIRGPCQEGGLEQWPMTPVRQPADDVLQEVTRQAIGVGEDVVHVDVAGARTIARRGLVS